MKGILNNMSGPATSETGKKEVSIEKEVLLWEPKHVLVTGSTGGLGEVLTKRLLDKGYIVTGINTGKKSELNCDLSLYAESCQNGTAYHPITFDLSDPDNLEHALQNGLIPGPDSISYVVFCHGANFKERILFLSHKKFEESMRLNSEAPLLLSQFFGRAWSKDINPNQVYDRCFVYVSSVAVPGGSEDEYAYHAAKRAAEAGMLSMARWGAQFGIRANTIRPGLMNTPMGLKTIADRPDVLDRIPLERLTTTTEIAKAIHLMLTSPAMTGEALNLNAGRHMDI